MKDPESSFNEKEDSVIYDIVSEASHEDDVNENLHTFPKKMFKKQIDVKCIKEGYLMKQSSNSFQRSQKRYFLLYPGKLYYAKTDKSVIFDEIDLRHCSLAESGTKNLKNSFTLITPSKSIVIGTESRKEMESWITAIKSSSNKNIMIDDPISHIDVSGQHSWYAASHARPTYCNVCREALSGVTFHGFSCEICKFKCHKRCAVKAINDCKWTTLGSMRKYIIEDQENNLVMPHQWIEGNLPVHSKCTVCDKNCGSVLRLQDWRCLWCRALAHNNCRHVLPQKCTLGAYKMSIVQPIYLHNLEPIESEHESAEYKGMSPLVVFVNSKSGDKQGIKIFRRFKQHLNPVQVFDLLKGGPTFGLKLFRKFEPFRICICGGDGSISWVLNEIDHLHLLTKCQVGLIPLGTGNDLSRVLGWGSTFDDDVPLTTLIERFERASVKMLDRWSIMDYQGAVAQIPQTLLLSPRSSLARSTYASKNDLNAVDEGHDVTLKNNDESPSTITTSPPPPPLIEAMIRDHLISLLFLLDQILTSTTTIDNPDSINCSSALINNAQKMKSHVLDILNCTTSSTRGNSPLETVENLGAPPDVDKIDKEKLESGLQCVFGDLTKILSDLKEVECVSGVLNDPNTDPTAIWIPRCLPDNLGCFQDKPGHDSYVSVEEINNLSNSPNDTLVACSPIESGSGTHNIDYNEFYECPGTPTSLFAPVAAEQAKSIGKMKESNNPDSAIVEMRKRFFDFTISPPKPNAEDAVDGNDDTIWKCRSPMNKVDLIVSPPSPLTTRPVEMLLARPARPGSGSGFGSTSVESLLDFSTSSMVGESEELGSRDVRSPSPTPQNNDQNFGSKSLLQPNYTYNQPSVDNANYLQLPSHAFNNYNKNRTQSSNYDGDASEMGEEDEAELDVFDISATASPSVSRRPSSVSALFGIETSQSCEELRQCLLERLKNLKLLARSLAMLADNNEDSNITDSLGNRKPNMVIPEVLIQDLSLESPSRSSQIKNILTYPMASNRSSISQSGGVGMNSNSLQPPLSPAPSLIDQASIHSSSSSSSYSSSASLSANSKNTGKSSITVNKLGPENKQDFIEGGKRLSNLENAAVKASTSSLGNIISRRLSRGSVFKLPTKISGKLSPKTLRSGLLFSPQSFAHPRSSIVQGSHLQKNYRVKSSVENSKATLGDDNAGDESSSTGGFKHVKKGSKGKQSSYGLISDTPRINYSAVNESLCASVCGNLIGQVLLANADALCAPALPLMDVDAFPLHCLKEKCVMNNYFGIGLDAKISLDFHNKREIHPDKASRTRNIMWYGLLGTKELLQNTFKNLEQRVHLECDGIRIPLPSLQGIVILNISSYAGGTNFWGGKKEDDIFLSPSFDDKILEVVAVFGSHQLAVSKVLNIQHHRIAQCRSVKITITGEPTDPGVPIQVDGEAWIQPPGCIRIVHKDRAQMLVRDKAFEAILKIWNANTGDSNTVPQLRKKSLTSPLRDLRQRHSIASPFIKRLSSVLDEEINALEAFKATASLLIECSKQACDINRKYYRALYKKTTEASLEMEKVCPEGKLNSNLPNMRNYVSGLIHSVKDLSKAVNEFLNSHEEFRNSNPTLYTKLLATLDMIQQDMKKLNTLGFCVKHSFNIMPHIGSHHKFGHEGKGKKSSHLQVPTEFVNPRDSQSSSQNLEQNDSTEDVNKKPIKKWTSQDVSHWLADIGLPEYHETFLKHDIRGNELLTLERKDFKELGITKVGHVKRISQAIKDLEKLQKR